MNPESLLDVAKLQLQDRYRQAAKRRYWNRGHGRQL